MISICTELKDNCSHNYSARVSLVLKSNLRNQTNGHAFYNLVIELISVVEWKPLSLQEFEFFNVSMLISSDGGKWNWVILQISSYYLVHFALYFGICLGRKGWRLHFHPIFVKTIMLINLISFILFEGIVWIAKVTLPGVDRLHIETLSGKGLLDVYNWQGQTYSFAKRRVSLQFSFNLLYIL